MSIKTIGKSLDTARIVELADLACRKGVDPRRPRLTAVGVDNPHGTNWTLIAAGDQGEEFAECDRYFARFESVEGYWADYFHYRGSWNLGAN